MTILQEENIKADPDKLKARFESVPSGTDTTVALADAITSHLKEDLSLEKEKVDKVLDEVKAALGLAAVEKRLENPEVLLNGDVEAKVEGHTNEPVLITDVHAWKAGLQLSRGVRPVRDLSDFLEGGAKL